MLKHSQYDTIKGSYYAAFMSSYPQAAHEDAQELPTFKWPNIWPSEDLLPGFRKTFEELCTIIIDIALLVAKVCNQSAVEFIPEYVLVQWNES